MPARSRACTRFCAAAALAFHAGAAHALRARVSDRADDDAPAHDAAGDDDEALRTVFMHGIPKTVRARQRACLADPTDSVYAS
jgi:hypothetical protein